MGSMRDFLEFIFCPQHGALRVMLVFVQLSGAAAVTYWLSEIKRKRRVTWLKRMLSGSGRRKKGS